MSSNGHFVIHDEEPENEAVGDCFAMAIDVAKMLYLAGAPRVEICHGTPIGQGKFNLNRKFWHAWVEITDERGPIVYDFSSGKRLVIRRAQYYRIGKIVHDEVYRFTMREAAHEAATRRHAGPWVDGWEKMRDIL